MKILIIKRAILTILCVAVMLIINFFSSQSANDSKELSRSVTRKIVSVMPNNDSENSQAAEDAKVLEKDEEVRSAAHVGLFLVLGIVLSMTLYEYNVPKAFLFAFLFCVLYAVFDEKYQELLEKGRAFEWVDLLKDWSGSFIGITFVAIAHRIRKKRKE